jgi:BCD family chlorophyll transporter-like MFS transporter
MTNRPNSATFWQTVGTRFLPFADAASKDLPLSRLLRLALFQVSVGIATVLLNGTLNRVLIVEMEMPTWIIALMIAIPLTVAPFRALIGYRSDTHRSVLGWRRVPYIWFGTLGQWGGLAIMPFALILITRSDTMVIGVAVACVSFLLTGAGMHVTQTAGLALATDLASEDKRPRVVALLYVMLLVGMMAAAFTIGELLQDFTRTKLIQIIQGAALLTMVLNVTALWKQEARDRRLAPSTKSDPKFAEVWANFAEVPRTRRLLLAIGVGALAFAMQDALLEPYGGEILGLSVGSTTALTGAWALGALIAFGLSAKRLSSGSDPLRLAGLGAVAGIAAFLMTLFAAPLASPLLLYSGATLIGCGAGLFSVGTMIAAMGLAKSEASGLALGAWGAVQASAAGLGIALGGLIRDGMAYAALHDGLGSTLAYRATGYGTVYLIEIILLLLALVILGPVIGAHRIQSLMKSERFGLSEFPT